MRTFRTMLSVSALSLLLAPSAWAAPAPPQGEGDPAVLQRMRQINEQLRARGFGLALEAIEVFTIGGGRPANRLHQQPAQWVPNDPRRLADGDNITYLVDQSDGATVSGLTAAETEGAIDRAFATWSRERCLRKVDLIKRPDTGIDPDILDGFVGFGEIGTPNLADIVNAGWYPRELFDAVLGPGAGNTILGFSLSFISIDDVTGLPTDINGDNYLDIALNEVYYNQNHGDPNGTNPGSPWGIDIAQPGYDVETVALHENGHSLGLGHFGAPPLAIMNTTYSGIHHEPFPIDHAGMCAVWSAWPNR
jgi:hypothetical protein